jgi:hypothetical protein
MLRSGHSRGGFVDQAGLRDRRARRDAEAKMSLDSMFFGVSAKT